jgi:adenosine kinase
MADQYKITIAGPIPYNDIATWKNEKLERYGCISYTAMALSKLIGQNARIIPVTHVRKKDEQTVKTLFKGFAGIELQYIDSDLDQGDVIRTRIVDEHKVLEKQYGFMNPIVPHDVRDLLDSDVFVFVPLTDFEVALDTLEFVKTYNKKTLVIFDAHGPTTTMTTLGDRLPKFWVERDLWLPFIDILVMNLEEAKCSWFAKEVTMEQLDDPNDLSQDELQKFAEHCLKSGPRALYVTLGEKGCLVFYKNSEEKIVKEQIKAVPVAQIASTAGCGEAFIGGLTYGLLTTNDYVKAAQYANAIGAQRCEALTYDVFKSLEETEKRIKDTY